MNMRPIFIKGDLTFKVDLHQLNYKHQNISVSGVTGLTWSVLNPEKHFGKEIEVMIRIPAKDTSPEIILYTPAQILRERTLHFHHMGLKFFLNEEQKERLSQQIADHGFYPSEYIRKYPRIPANRSIETFPLRVLGTPILTIKQAKSGELNDSPIIFDVENLSPNGILLSTENRMALNIVPGQHIHLVLEPRGWFPVQIQVDALVCRSIDVKNSQHEQMSHLFGLKFVKVDQASETAFIELLKDILEQIKYQQPAGS